MAVTFYNFPQLHNEQFQAEMLERLKEILATNAFVDGKWNKQFESEFAQMQDAKHCLLVANGTDSMEICLQALDMKPGDKVAMPAISFFATAEVVMNRGGIPVFVDIDPKTGLICLDSFKRIIAKHDIKVVMPVHIYGQAAPVEELMAICKPKNIHIIEDAAQAQGTYYKNGKPVGSLGNLTSFSFYPTKNLGALGDAGGILTGSDSLKDTMMSIRNHGRSPNGHVLIGRNSRCDHMQAAALQLKLKTTPAQNQMRKDIAKKYLEAMKGLPIRTVPMEQVSLSSWHLMPIGLRTREEKYECQKYLGGLGIGTSLFYEKAMAEEKPLLHLEGEKENALHFAATTLCLPMNPFITDKDIQEVVGALKAFLK